MLQIQNVTLIHRRDNRTLIEGLSFVLRPGDRIAVIGEEGNGKSTLLKWLYDPALTQPYIAATGERIVRDETLGYLPQELPPAQRAASVYEFFCAEEAFYAKRRATWDGWRRRLALRRIFSTASSKWGRFRAEKK